MTIFLSIILLLALGVYLYRYLPMSTYARLRERMIRQARRRVGFVYHKAQVGEHEWPYLEAGAADAPVVLFVHGFGADKDNALFFAPHMVRAGYRVIAPDQVGFGENTPDDSLPYDMKSQAARLVAFLDAIKVDSVHIVGNSMGGWISLYVALEWAERVKTLTLMNTAGVRGANPSELEGMARDGDNPLIATDKDSMQNLLRFVLHKPPFVPSNFLAVEGAKRAERAPLFEKIFDQLLAEYDSDSMHDRLPEVKAPTLIVWGDRDRVLDVSCTDVLHAAIPTSEVAVMKDIGHMPLIEAPRAFSGILSSFIARYRST